MNFKGRQIPTRAVFFLALNFSILFGIWYGLSGRFDLVLSDSVPYRLFWLEPKEMPGKKWDYAMLTINHPKEHTQMPVTKLVACVAGEMLAVEGTEYFCNGEYLGSAKTEWADHTKTQRYVASGLIPPGMAFVLGHAYNVRGGVKIDDSYDSRYFGLVPVKNMVRALPIW